MNDLLRARVVCKFIDGPGFVTERLMGHAKNKGVIGRSYTQQRDEGYYAYHFYGTFSFGTMGNTWNEEMKDIEVEIQVTTQLQDVLNMLTHAYYEQQRISSDKDSDEWKWEYGTSRFRARYLSHTLHMLEGIIVELRDDSRKDQH